MFGTWIGWIAKPFDYINRVNITLLLSVYEGTWTHSPLLLLCITMILRVRRKFFEITTFPNTTRVIVNVHDSSLEIRCDPHILKKFKMDQAKKGFFPVLQGVKLSKTQKTRPRQKIERE